MSHRNRHVARTVVLLALAVIALMAPTHHVGADAVVDPVEIVDNGLDAEATWTLWTEAASRPSPEPAFDGDLATCDPGSVSADYLEALAERVDVFRRLAGVPPIALDRSSVAVARQQAAALMVAVGPEPPTHRPPEHAACASAAGIEASATSNLFRTTGYAAIAGYIEDRRRPDVGHRRWLLAEGQQRIAIGEVPGANTIEVVEGMTASDPSKVVVWPAAGYVPADLVPARWSLQSPRTDLFGADVDIEATIDGRGADVTDLQIGSADPEAFVAFVLPPVDPGSVVEVTVSGLDPAVAGTTALRWRTTVIDADHLDVEPRAAEAVDAFVYLMGRSPNAAERALLDAQPGTTLAALVGTGEQIGADVDRLYHSMLGRRPDAGGRAFWIEQISSGSLTLRDVVVAFFVSAEFIDRTEAGGAGPPGWVDAIYRSIHQRRPDAGGRAFWIERIDAGELGRARIVAEFYDSPESVRRRVTRLSAALLGRPATETELARWSEPDQRDYLVAVFRSTEFAALAG